MAKPANNVHDVDDQGWETIVAPYGPTFEFKNEGDMLTGTFVSKREVEQEDDNGDPRMVNVYEIVSDSDGTAYSVWGNYSVNEGLVNVVAGEQVRIMYHGKADLKGGRTVNKMTVQVKRS